MHASAPDAPTDEAAGPLTASPTPLLQPGNMPQADLHWPEPLPDSLDDWVDQLSPTAGHAWTACSASAFNVRCGPGYKANRKKAPSAPSLYEAFAVDGFRSDKKLPHIGRVAALPVDPAPPDPSCGLPPYLIINWMVPDYPVPALWDKRRLDGPGWNLVLYCRLSDETRERLRHRAALPASAELVRRFMHPELGASLRGQRLKCIFGTVPSGLACFGVVQRQLLTRYNYKPFLSRTASRCYLASSPTQQRYFEIDVDIHTWGQPALTAFSTIKEKIPHLLIRGGIVIEAVEEAELPEQMLGGCGYLLRIDPQRGITIPPEIARYLWDSATHVPPLAVGSSGAPSAACNGNAFPTTPLELSPREHDHEEEPKVEPTG